MYFRYAIEYRYPNSEPSMEELFDSLYEKLRSADSNSEPLISAILESFDKHWDARTEHSMNPLCTWISAFLGDGRSEDAIWAWVCLKAKNANLNDQVALTVGVFRILAEEPQDIKWLGS